MTFTLDTSGVVPACGSSRPRTPYWPERRWTDLSPFAQGYTAPILEAVGAPFHKLAPETLELILKDCEQQATVYTDRKPDRLDGQIFWDGRKNHVLRPYGFPPLTVTLSDDGKVRLRSARTEEVR